MRVKDIMSREIKTCRPDDTIHKVAKDMVNHNVSILVVVSNKNDRVIPLGVISKSDIASKVVGAGRNAKEMTVREVFCAPVRTIYEMDTVVLLSEKLHERNLRNMIVLNEDERMVGICGTTNILKFAGGKTDFF